MENKETVRDLEPIDDLDRRAFARIDRHFNKEASAKIEPGGGLVGNIEGGVVFDTSVLKIGVARMLEVTSVLCAHEDGRILQLWQDRNSRYLEWRELPSFAEASKTYRCDTIK